MYGIKINCSVDLPNRFSQSVEGCPAAFLKLKGGK